MSETGQEAFGGAVVEALGGMALSLIALLVLAVFYDAVETLGSAQLWGLLALHAIALWLLWSSLQSGSAGPAIFALLLGVGWNVAAILYLISRPTTAIIGSYVVDRPPPTKEFAGAAFLTYWYVSRIVKIANAS